MGEVFQDTPVDVSKHGESTKPIDTSFSYVYIPRINFHL